MSAILNHLPWSIRALLVRKFLNYKNIVCDDCPTFDGLWPQIFNEGRIVFGTACTFRSFRVKQHITVKQNAVLEIGHHSYLNDGINICATKKITIGHHAKIGDMVFIYDTDFHQVSPDSPVKVLPVSIGNNVWIGANSMILPGAKIGDHSVIAAGSIVTGEIPERSIAAGVPARVIRTFAADDEWVRN